MVSMSAFLIQVLWVLGGILFLLSLYIVVNKAVRESRERRAERIRRELEPIILRHINGAGEKLARQLPPLGRRERPVVEGILLDNARFLKGTARERISAACEELGYVEERIRQLRNPRWWKRAEAAEKLGTMMSPRAAAELIPLMRDQITEVRMRAARALGELKTPTSIRPLIEALQDPSRWSALRIADILAGMGPEAADELVDQFATLPIRVRVAAVDCLGRAKSRKAPDLLVSLLSDPDRDIRARAAHALGLIGDPNFTPELVKTLKDQEWPARAMAAKALGRLGRPEAVGYLKNVLKDQEWWVRINAAEGLRALGDLGLASLMDAIDSDDRYARHAAVATLEGAGVLDQFVEKLASPDAAEREKGLAFIRKIVASERTDHLLQAAARHAQDKVREQLSRILQPGEVNG